MAEGKKYIIKVSSELVEVSEDIYRAYYGMERHVRHLDEKDEAHGKVLYSNLDTEDTLGEEMIPDCHAVSVEDAAIAHILYEELHRCLEMLPDGERELLYAVFFENMSLRQISELENIPVMTLCDRKAKAIQKLRKNFLKK